MMAKVAQQDHRRLTSQLTQGQKAPTQAYKHILLFISEHFTQKWH